jgi:hypothetical protein
VENVEGRSRIEGVSLADEEFLGSFNVVNYHCGCVAQLDLEDRPVSLSPFPVGFCWYFMAVLGMLARRFSDHQTEAYLE